MAYGQNEKQNAPSCDPLTDCSTYGIHVKICFTLQLTTTELETLLLAILIFFRMKQT